MEHVDDFNTVLLDLARNISNICKNSIIGRNFNDIERAIKNPNNKTKFIDLFVGKILIYKEQIDAGDENFFLGKSYKDDLGSSNQFLDKVFEFKDIWYQLKPENREIVKSYMQHLAYLAQEYFLKTIN